MLEGSAEYYSANLSQNIKRGMRFNALECKVNNGSMPLGYCKGPDGRYAVVESEAVPDIPTIGEPQGPQNSLPVSIYSPFSRCRP